MNKNRELTSLRSFRAGAYVCVCFIYFDIIGRLFIFEIQESCVSLEASRNVRVTVHPPPKRLLMWLGIRSSNIHFLLCGHLFPMSVLLLMISGFWIFVIMQSKGRKFNDLAWLGCTFQRIPTWCSVWSLGCFPICTSTGWFRTYMPHVWNFCWDC